MKTTVRLNIELPENVSKEDLHEFMCFTCGFGGISISNLLYDMELCDLVRSSYDIDID